MRPDDKEGPGWPWLRSWGRVYALVAGSFVLWVVLMVILARLFR